MSVFISYNGLLRHNKPEIILSTCRRLIEVVSEACCCEQSKIFYKPCTRTNIGKRYVSSTVVDFWQDLPISLKNLNTFTFLMK